MKPRRQDERRRQLVEAARRVLLERGAVGLRVKDVAERTGLAPSTVLYYYPEIADLLLEVGSAAMSRYAERRAEAVRAFDAPSASFFDRQVALYEGILAMGQAGGDFKLAAPAPTLARGLVAMEDGLGLQVVIGHTA